MLVIRARFIITVNASAIQTRGARKGHTGALQRVDAWITAITAMSIPHHVTMEHSGVRRGSAAYQMELTVQPSSGFVLKAPIGVHLSKDV